MKNVSIKRHITTMSIVLMVTMMFGVGSIFADNGKTSSSPNDRTNDSHSNSTYDNNSGGMAKGTQDVTFSTMEEQLSLAKKELSPERYAVMVEKFKPVPYSASMKSDAWSHLPNTYTCYAQTEEMYCIPACAQATLKYLTGVEYDQAFLARELKVTPTGGGNFNNLAPYLNKKQDANSYILMGNTTPQSTMQGHLFSAIRTYKAPATLRVAIDFTSFQEGDWPDTSPGHATNVNAARDDRTSFQMADPGIGYYHEELNPFYPVESQNIYNAITTNRYCGYIY